MNNILLSPSFLKQLKKQTGQITKQAVDMLLQRTKKIKSNENYFRYKRVPISEVNLKAWHIITLSDNELKKLIMEYKRCKHSLELTPMCCRRRIHICYVKLKMLRAIKYDF